MKTFQLLLKRLFDILFSLAGVVLFLLVWVILAIPIRLTTHGSVLFCQTRTGKDRKPFTILKFRTMVVDEEAETHYDKSMDEERLTALGRLMRRLKLDEIPQFINIFRGDMSFVGPRPYIEQDGEALDSERFAMRPGLTGLAQINGNTCLSWEERTVYDVRYVREFSLALDLEILAGTMKVIVKGEEACVRHVC